MPPNSQGDEELPQSSSPPYLDHSQGGLASYPHHCLAPFPTFQRNFHVGQFSGYFQRVSRVPFGVFIAKTTVISFP
ncbi:hypothetical protein SK128_000904 [Halocaridina rubra]|uniref:Uncharacterized protein n=1 Tax=Halocaridina rubra TaxID=373956 RepID=A0AAN9A6D8_HALRR